MLIPVRTGDAVADLDERPPTLAARRSAGRLTPPPAWLWLLAALVVAGAALRFTALAHQSYWFDEAQAAHELRLSFGAMIHSWSANEPNPPLFFVLAWVWVKIFGASEVGLRSFSALCGTAVIPVAFLCGRELVDRRAGLVAAGLVAVSPFMIWYSQEAREYMLLALCSGGSLLCFARASRAPSRRRLAWWAAVSALALTTQYFAFFLVAGEAVLLGYRLRSRDVLIAVLALAAIEAALLPHAISHQSHPTGWIDAFALHVRVQQVPVAFALGQLYLSSAIIGWGLIGAAALAGCLIVLLVVGADGDQLRGAGLAAALAAAVLLVPLALALAGHDYYEARALMPAWIPLVVLIGAACTAPRAPRVAGGALGLALAAGFIYGQARVASSSVYQRPDWRGVAAALGRPAGRRAIVAYDGTAATAPLALYLPGVPWTSRGQNPQTGTAPVSIVELDVIGNVYQQIPHSLPPGVRLLAAGRVGAYYVARFGLGGERKLTRSAIAQVAPRLLGPAAPGAAVLVQHRLPSAAAS